MYNSTHKSKKESKVSFVFQRSEGPEVGVPMIRVRSRSCELDAPKLPVALFPGILSDCAGEQCPLSPLLPSHAPHLFTFIIAYPALQHCAGINSLLISEDGRHLWTASRDSTVKR
jgi:hypothetical protein